MYLFNIVSQYYRINFEKFQNFTSTLYLAAKVVRRKPDSPFSKFSVNFQRQILGEVTILANNCNTIPLYSPPFKTYQVSLSPSTISNSKFRNVCSYINLQCILEIRSSPKILNIRLQGFLSCIWRTLESHHSQFDAFTFLFSLHCEFFFIFCAHTRNFRHIMDSQTFRKLWPWTYDWCWARATLNSFHHESNEKSSR